MAFEIHRDGLQFPLKAASQLFAKEPVTLVPAASGVLQVRRVTAKTDRPIGFVREMASAGFEVAVLEEGNYVKAIAAASVGFGGEVGLASVGVATNAATAGATVAMLGPISAASGTGDWAIGVAYENASGGDTFTVFVKPRQIAGQA